MRVRYVNERVSFPDLIERIEGFTPRPCASIAENPDQRAGSPSKTRKRKRLETSPTNTSTSDSSPSGFYHLRTYSMTCSSCANPAGRVHHERSRRRTRAKFPKYVSDENDSLSRRLAHISEMLSDNDRDMELANIKRVTIDDMREQHAKEMSLAVKKMAMIDEMREQVLKDMVLAGQRIEKISEMAEQNAKEREGVTKRKAKLEAEKQDILRWDVQDKKVTKELEQLS